MPVFSHTNIKLLNSDKIIPYHPSIKLNNCQIDVKRLDQLNAIVSGNKFFKLKYNLIQVLEQQQSPIISFGGAYSNHVYALAHACHELKLSNIAIIRGDELAHKPLNKPLTKVSKLGTKLQFITREEYRKKHTTDFLQKLLQKYPSACIIPEGGTNELAIKGTQEILSEADCHTYDLICLAVGTGGTISGIINASRNEQEVIGFSALNSTYQQNDIIKWTNKENWKLLPDEIFGGYAKKNESLLMFIHNMKEKYELPVEPIYTGKALYRLWQMIEQEKITNKKILFIHTGGLDT